MDYFRNDRESSAVADLTIENGIGSVSLYGNMVIRPDSASLRSIDLVIKRLAEIRRAAEEAIRGGFEVKDEVIPLDVVDNPFS